MTHTTQRPFSGLTTALVTPFESGDPINAAVDYTAFERLIDMQLAADVDGILLLWTTWENPTLAEAESIQIVERAIEQVAWRTNIIVNTWTNATNESLRYMELYNNIEWIDGYLAVNPYYNKPTQAWMQQHFWAIADHTDRPVLLYNIEWRTSVNFETDSLLKTIEDHSNIVGIKEASGNMDQMVDVISRTPDDFTVLSWDDGLTAELIRNGWDGVVSVASNIIPSQLQDLINRMRTGDESAYADFEQYQDLFNNLFVETNPGPVKTLLAEMWIIEDSFRLPMTQISPENREQIMQTARRYGIV